MTQSEIDRANEYLRNARHGSFCGGSPCVCGLNEARRAILELAETQDSLNGLRRTLDEAFNSGDGVYRP